MQSSRVTLLAAIAALLLTSPPGRCGTANAADDFQRISEAWGAKQYLKALELGETFLAQHPDHPKLANALFLAGRGGLESWEFQRAEVLFRRVLEEHPQFGQMDGVRTGLAQCLSGMRSFDACIKQCQENLAAAPDSFGADYWRFLIPHCRFRQWRFEEAEQGFKAILASHPRSEYVRDINRYLTRISPSWDVDGNAVAAYTGKFEGDYRLKAAMDALPRHIQAGREQIRDALGVDIDVAGKMNFLFRDAGTESHGGLSAETFIISRDYKPVTALKFYTEYVVADPEDYGRTLIHEMKHAGFKTIMGPAYDDLPAWISEGLAQWAADQLAHKMRSHLNNRVFSGKDPLGGMNGIANPVHGLGDYLEDVLAFEWLEKQKQGNVKAFCKGLVAGTDWRALMATVTGMRTDDALRRMDRYCRDRIAGELGVAGREVIALREAFFAKGAAAPDALTTWLQEIGNARFAKWLAEHPGHVLEPVATFYCGRGLILTDQFAEGRKRLRTLLEEHDVSSLHDDALFWEGYAFQQEGLMENAERSFRVLLRDYSWASSASKVRGKFEPAGPETGEPNEAVTSPHADTARIAKATSAKGAVKVYILFGQSNMLGFGTVSPEEKKGTLMHAVKVKGKYQNLVDENADWVVREDVRYVHVMQHKNTFKTLRNEWLTVGGDYIGPEMGIGHALGDYHDDTVLVLKACIGNRSLGWDYLPPGSERFEYRGTIHAGYHDTGNWTKSETPKTNWLSGAWYAGKQYDDDTRYAKAVLADLDIYCPGAKEYEIGGFFWWQGHKDQNKVHAMRYEHNLVNLIKALRKDFNAPDAPFALATVAFGGRRMANDSLTIAKAQLAVDGETGNYPEFKGNVKSVDARPFWQPARRSPGGGGHHYNGNAETYMDVGIAMGEGMVELLKARK